jgi:8-oxo-dGTP pyrophosphatase MutT (NUDIX family)
MPAAADVIASLHAHSPADEREADYVRRMVFLAAGDTPFARDHFVPGHFTASAFVLSPDRKDLLLILHGKLGLWLQPGGHVDAADLDLLAAARREASEETGLQGLQPLDPPLLDVDIHRIPPNPRKGEPAHEHFDVRFVFVAPHRQLSAGSDAQDARWVPLGEVEDAGTDESVSRAVRKLVAALDRGPGVRYTGAS